jgi:hypothetical protein
MSYPFAMRKLALVIIGVLVLVAAAGTAAAPPVVSHVIVITMDGMRWQELFGGAERSLLGKDETAITESASYRRFWKDSAEERRAALMPFFWTVVAKRGQIFGDPARGGRSRLTNGLWFSYPGYSEMLAGVADPRVDSNDKIPNPNVTVLEWLNGLPGYRGRVETFGAWDVLPYIVNAQRSGLPAGDGYPPVPDPKTDRERAINDMADDLPPLWAGAPLDAPIMHAAIECLRTRRPRVLYVMLGETDEWAHERRYDLYLDAAFRADRFMRRVWEMVQGMPEYAGTTALVLATDHGRGAADADWTSHGRKVPAAEATWAAVMGPATPALGVRASVAVTTSQVAATVAALLGEDFRAAVPAAAPPLPMAR